MNQSKIKFLMGVHTPLPSNLEIIAKDFLTQSPWRVPESVSVSFYWVLLNVVSPS